MSLVPPVFRWLTDEAAVRTMVGAAKPRVYRNEAPDLGSTPSKVDYIVWRVIAGVAQNYLAERPDMDNFRVQVDCYSADAARCLKLAEAAQFALDDKGHQLAVIADERDIETGLYRYGFDYSFWVGR